MMYHMGCPKKPTFVRNSMKPVISKIIGEENKHNTPPGYRNSKKPKMIVNVEKDASTIALLKNPSSTLPIPMLIEAKASLVS